jgi:hypothetical protein
MTVYILLATAAIILIAGGIYAFMSEKNRS